MLVKVTSKRQVTFPKRVLDAIGVAPGDQLELREAPGGVYLSAKPADEAPEAESIAYTIPETLRDKIKPGTPPFDIRKFRDERERGHGPALRR